LEATREAITEDARAAYSKDAENGELYKRIQEGRNATTDQHSKILIYSDDLVMQER